MGIGFLQRLLLPLLDVLSSHPAPPCAAAPLQLSPLGWHLIPASGVSKGREPEVRLVKETVSCRVDCRVRSEWEPIEQVRGRGGRYLESRPGWRQRASRHRR